MTNENVEIIRRISAAMELSVPRSVSRVLWTLKDGKAVRMQSYWEREDALEAVGLSEQDARAEAP